MVKCDVLFEVRTEFLNNIYTSFGFKGLSIFHKKWEYQKGSLEHFKIMAIKQKSCAFFSAVVIQ
jgi:hypothetical protein